MDIETEWNSAKKVWLDVCEETIGKKKSTHKNWMSLHTMERLEERKKCKAELNNRWTRSDKAQAQEKFSMAHREVQKHIHRDKRKYMDNLTKEVEEAAVKRDLKELYSMTRILAGKYQ